RKQATAHDATALAEFGAELHFVRCRSFLGRGDGRAGDDDEQGARTPRGGRESPAATGADGQGEGVSSVKRFHSARSFRSFRALLPTTLGSVHGNQRARTRTPRCAPLRVALRIRAAP